MRVSCLTTKLSAPDNAKTLYVLEYHAALGINPCMAENPTQANLRSAPTPISVSTQTTEYQLTSELLVNQQPPDNMQLARDSAVSVPENVIKDLEKYYPVFEGTWSAATARGATIDMFDPFYLLLQKPFLQQRLAGYHYIRANVEYMVSIISAPGQYGNIITSYLSDYDPTWAYAYEIGHYVTRSRNHATIMSVALGTSAKQVLPDICPQTWRRIDQVTEFSHTCFVIDVFDPLLNSFADANDSCTVRVDARLKDVLLSGFNPDGVVALPKPKYSSVLKARLETAREDQKKFLGSLVSQSSEAIAKAENPLVVGVKEISSLVSGSIGPVAQLASILAPLAGFDKPGTVASVERVVLDSNADLIYGKGTFPFNQLSLMPTKGIATNGSVMAERNPAPSVYDVAKNLSLVKHGQFTADTPVNTVTFPMPLALEYIPKINTIVASDAVTTDVYCPTYASVVTSLFGFNRANMRVFLRFTTSPHITAQIRILYFSRGLPTTPLVSTYAGASYTEVIQVNGDREWDHVFPYEHIENQRYLATPTNTFADYPHIALCLESPLAYTQAGTSPAVNVSFWTAAGEGTTWSEFIGVAKSYATGVTSFYSEDPSLPLVSQTSMDAKSREKPPPFLDLKPTSSFGMTTDEPQFSLLTLMKRMCLTSQTSTTGGSAVDAYYPPTGNIPYHGRLILRLFQRSRGSFVLYMRSPTAQMEFSRTWDGNEDPMMVGSVRNNPAREPYLGVIVPYISRADYYDRTQFGPDYKAVLATSSSTLYLYGAVGDDFTLGGLKCPPLYCKVTVTSPKPNSASGVSSKGF